MKQSSLKTLLSISLIIFLLGLSLTRYGLLNFTQHISNKSPIENPFVESTFDYSGQTLWNSKLYNKIVVFLLENYSYEWVSNDPNAQRLAPQDIQYNYQWTLFDDLVKRQPQSTVFRKIDINSPQSTLVKIATYMIGTNSVQFEVGIQSKNQFQVVEDSIFYQLKQSKYSSVGFLNDNWYKSFPNLLGKSNYLLQDKQNNKEDIDQNLLDYQKIQDLINQGSFDFLFIHDSVQVIDLVKSEQSSTEELKIKRIEEQMKSIIENMSNDTLFIALSDRASNNFGGKNENVNTCFSDKPCAPFLFAYTKGGFNNYQDLLKEINSDVVKQQNMIHESQIASTIANIMGLPIPFSNSGRTIFDIYPSNLNENSFIKRILQDSYTNLMQQYQFIQTLHKKNGLFAPLQIRKYAEEVEKIRNSLPKLSFEKEKVVPIIRNIVNVQEEIRQQIYSTLYPYGMTWIIFGYVILFFSILMAICLIISSSKDNKKEKDLFRQENNLNTSEITNNSRDYDPQIVVTKKGKAIDVENQNLIMQQEEEQTSQSIDLFLNMTILGQNFLYFYDSWNYQLTEQNYTSNQATCIVIMSAELFLYFMYQLYKKSNVQSLWMPILICFLIVSIKFLFVNRYIFQSSLPIVPFSEIAYPVIFFIIIYIANSFAQVQYSSKKYSKFLILLNVFSIIVIILQDAQFNIISSKYNRIVFSVFGLLNLGVCHLIKRKNNQTNLFLLINQQLGLVQIYIAIFDSSEKTEYLGLVDYLITSILIIIVFGLFQLLSRFSIQIYLVFLNTIFAFSSGIVKDSTSDKFNIFKNIYFTLFGIYLLNVQLLLNKEKTQIDSLSSYLTKINNSGNYKHESHKYIKVFGQFSIAIMIQIVFFFTSFLSMVNKFYFNLHFQTHSVFCNEQLASFAAHTIIMIYFIATYKSLLKDRKSKSQQPNNNYEMVQQSHFSNLNSSL